MNDFRLAHLNAPRRRTRLSGLARPRTVRSAPVTLHNLWIEPETNQIPGSGAPIPSRCLQTLGIPEDGCKAERDRQRDDNPPRSLCERAEKISQRGLGRDNAKRTLQGSKGT
jgi:hypothetical protein